MQLTEGRAEIAADVRQSDVDDRDVELQHEGRHVSATTISVPRSALARGIEQLRSALGLAQPGTVRLMDRLEREGWAQRKAGDGRAVDVALTPAGRRVVTRLLSARDEALHEILEPLGPTERGQLSPCWRSSSPPRPANDATLSTSVACATARHVSPVRSPARFADQLERDLRIGTEPGRLCRRHWCSPPSSLALLEKGQSCSPPSPTSSGRVGGDGGDDLFGSGSLGKASRTEALTAGDPRADCCGPPIEPKRSG